jgi:CTP:molybdopterin cytidylyltransferase MocA
MHKNDKVVALILAAGFSSRMGNFKSLLPLGSDTVIAYTVKHLREAGIDDIRVVVGHRSEELMPVLSSLNVMPIFNANYAGEMYVSILTGLRTFSAEAGAFFLLPCDIPLVKRHTIKAILRKYYSSDAAIIYPTFRDERGHPPLITARCFSDILSWNGPGGLRTVLEKFTFAEVEVADQAVIMDMDTPEDYEIVRNYFAGQGIPALLECEAILKKFKTPSKAIRHGQAVAKVAGGLASHLKAAGLQINGQLVVAGSLLHDMAKHKVVNHARRGARMLHSIGYPAVANVVGTHMDLQFKQADQVNENALVYLADKLVMHDQFVGLDIRRENARNKFAGDSAALISVEQRMCIAQIIQDKIFNALGITNFGEIDLWQEESQWRPCI